MTDQRSAAIRSLLAGASYNVGEWIAGGSSGWSDGWTKIKGGPAGPTLGHARVRDADLIVASVNAMPRLLDELDGLRAVLDAAHVLKHTGRAEPLHDALRNFARIEDAHAA